MILNNKNVSLKNNFRVYKIKIAENEVILEDSLFNIFSDPEPIHFRSIEDISQVSKSSVNDRAGSIIVRVELDGKVHQHRRSVLTFLEVTGINIILTK